jgi:hypothetical protein
MNFWIIMRNAVQEKSFEMKTDFLERGQPS